MHEKDIEEAAIILLEGIVALLKTIKKMRVFLEKIRARPP